MIRILYITNARLSFSRAHARNIVKTAEYVNQEPDCAVTVFSSAAESQSKKTIFEAKGVIRPFPLDIALGRRSLLFAMVRLRSTYDILYYRDPRLFFVAFLARFLFRKQVVFEVHGSHEWRFLKIVWLLAFYMADGAVFITERLRQWYRASATYSVVTHANAVDDIFFNVDKVAMRKETRARLGVSDDIFLAGYIGSTLWYDVTVLVGMLPFLSGNVSLLLVGMKQDEEKRIRAYARTQQVENRLIIYSRVPSYEVFSYLVACDVLLIPPLITYPGSISSKVYEYVATGVPIVAHPAGANDEVLHDGKNALLVRGDTPSLFADAIKRLQNDKHLRSALSQQALGDARAYTWKRRANDISTLLYKVTSIPHPQISSKENSEKEV